MAASPAPTSLTRSGLEYNDDLAVKVTPITSRLQREISELVEVQVKDAALRQEMASLQGEMQNEISCLRKEVQLLSSSSTKDRQETLSLRDEMNKKITSLLDEIKLLRSSSVNAQQQQQQQQYRHQQQQQQDEDEDEDEDEENQVVEPTTNKSLLDNGDRRETSQKISLQDNERRGMSRRSSSVFVLLQDDDIALLPADTSSFSAFVDYRSPPFRIMIAASGIQVATYTILILDIISRGSPDNVLGVPVNLPPLMLAVQFLTLGLTVMSQNDILQSLNVFYYGYDQSSLDLAFGNGKVTHTSWFISAISRLSVGIIALVTTYMVIITSTTSSELLLSFAEIEFVSFLDNIIFAMASWGYFGRSVKQTACRLRDSKFNAKYLHQLAVNRRKMRRRQSIRLFVLFLLILGLLGGWAYIVFLQATGAFLCSTVFVQFGDDFSPDLATFSGLYEIVANNPGDRRVQYLEDRPGNTYDGSARLAYCYSDSAWTLSHRYSPDGATPDPCNWLSRSSPLESQSPESYDILMTTYFPWYNKNRVGGAVPAQHFIMQCFDCSSDPGFCGGEGRGVCVNNRCECNEEWYGLRCESPQPCNALEVDIRSPPYQDAREWSREYNILTLDDDDGITTQVAMNHHPIYVSEGDPFDVIFFIGRRWAIATSEVNGFFRVKDDANFAKAVANDFHPYWSNYSVGFLSVPVDVDTPNHAATPVGLSWFQASTHELSSAVPGVAVGTTRRLQAPDPNRASETVLLCSRCANETNRCAFDGLCPVDGTCECTTGSSGTLCQVTPDGNGLCDVFFNTPEFGYDGGDCCAVTCVSTTEHTCGNGVIGNAFGILAYGYVGFPDCEDPRARLESQISGSTTLYDIIERGRVLCGSLSQVGFLEFVDGVPSGFEVDFCRAIAAAVLGDDEAIEMVEIRYADRFKDLVAPGKVDILFARTTYTAERDIHEKNAMVGFSFLSVPYFFDGLKYAGIPPYGACADNLDYTSIECTDLKICVPEATTWYPITESLFPISVIVAVAAISDIVPAMEAGLCNAIAGESSDLVEDAVRGNGFTGPAYEIGNNLHSKEPLSVVTSQTDRVWSKFASWVFEALVQAEESGITKATADSLATTDVFGEQFQDMFKNAVGANGNYGEIYEKNLQALLPRGGLNAVNNGTSGLIYSFPFGNTDTKGPEPNEGGTIAVIRRRGYLICGVVSRGGFSVFDSATTAWSGIDVDICRGISAALFNGEVNVQFTPLTFRERFSALAAGAIDILAGVTHTLAREVIGQLGDEDGAIGTPFDFTPIYFYDGLGFAGRLPYASCADQLTFDGSIVSPDCPNTKICVADGTSWIDAIRGPLSVPIENTIVTASHLESKEKLSLGECNVIAGETIDIGESVARASGYEDEEYYIGTQKFTREPLAVVSRSDDVEFSDFLRWIMFAYFSAEEQGITQGVALRMPATTLFGASLSKMWQHSIGAVGNYGEMFGRNFAGLVERGGGNGLNSMNGPQQFAKPGVRTV